MNDYIIQIVEQYPKLLEVVLGYLNKNPNLEDKWISVPIFLMDGDIAVVDYSVEERRFVRFCCGNNIDIPLPKI